MRALLALLLLPPSVFALAPAPAEDSLAPVCTGTTSIVAMPPLRTFHPLCAEIDSGWSITWLNAATTVVDPRSRAPIGAEAEPGTCFWAREDVGLLGEGDSYTLRFHYDGERLLSHFDTPMGIDTHDCTAILDPLLTTPGRAVVRYEDRILRDPLHEGTLVVLKTALPTSRNG